MRPILSRDPASRRSYSGTGFVLACALAAAGFVAFLVVVSPVLRARTEAAAPPPAPHEIAAFEASGTRWEVTAVERATDEPCLEVAAPEETVRRLCTGPRGDALRAVELLAAGGRRIAYGIVDARTTDVRLELADGSRIQVAPTYVDFGFPLGFFAVPVAPDAALLRVEALDSDGELRGAAPCRDGTCGAGG